MPKDLKVVTYARVSTSDKGQNPDVQTSETRRYCEVRDWVVHQEIVDEGHSGGTDQRPGLKKLFELVRSGEIDVVVVVKMDRLFRSLRHLILTLHEFETLGVQFVSVGDNIDLSTASGRLMAQIIGAFGEFERALIRERTIAGLNHARNTGKTLGRPRIHSPDAVIALRAKGLSYRAIAKELKIPMGTITRALRGAHKTPRKPGGSDV